MSIFRNRVLIAVALGHFAVDALANLVPVLVAFLSFPLGLSIAQVGLAGTIYAIAGSLSQPYFGHLADQGKGRTLAIMGLFWIVLWLGIAAFVPSYALLALCLGMAGLGSGAFHPQGAMNAFLHGGGRGGGLSIWYVGGAIGYALSPAVAGFVIQRVGQIGILYISLTMLPAAIVLAKYLPSTKQASASRPSTSAPQKRTTFADFLHGRWALAPWVLVGFLLLVICRSWVSVGMNTYVPKLYAGWGYLPMQYGSILSAILLADAAGGFLGGFIADRVGKRRVITLSMSTAAPALLLFFLLPPPWNLVFGVMGGFALNISQSVTLLIGQGLLPGRVGLASGLIMGFTFVAGALAASASGALADQIGLLVTLRMIALLPLVGAACSLLLPRDRARGQSRGDSDSR